MKKRRNFWSTDILLILLGAAALAFGILLAVAKPAYLPVVLGILLVILLVAFFCLQHIRRLMRRLLGGRSANTTFSGLSTLSVPVVALSNDTIVWYNDAFLHGMMEGSENCLLPLEKVVPGLNLEMAAAPTGQDVLFGGRRYTAYGNSLNADRSIFFVLFVEDTLLKTRAEEYLACRPTVIYFTIDTYDEILKEMRESERALIVSKIDMALESYVARADGFLRRVTASRYLAVVEERRVQDMIAGRFSILDEVRGMDHETATVTLSLGVGRQGASFRECEEWAQQALDMALGRGGDQAAVKGPDGFEFYGGVARSVEKRTKVKSRIIATAIKEVLSRYDRVLVMGHKDSDMDSVGAAVGMLRFCRICEKPAAIVIDEHKTLAGSLVQQLQQHGYGEDLLSPEEALPLTGPRTLLIIVDTHIHYLLESDLIYQSCGGVVVIDHHRMMVGHIDNAQIFYHEPYASSASELVSELLQYVHSGSKDDKPTPVEAEALLAGIMLDTRTFSLHVGVRTFEAAAWLRRMGAQTAAVKKLFTSSMDEYLYRSHLVSEAQVYEGCAVALSDRVPEVCEVVAPQAANELLGIEGVQASFVGIKIGNTVRISARSMGDVNVQLVMEKIGGGGHLTMAGAQLKDVDLPSAQQILFGAISSYMAERTHA